MASGEQPPKKRKFYEQQPRLPSSPPLSQPPPPPLQTLVPPNSVGTPQSLPNDEIIKKRRHRDEIRSVYECYKRIKFCLSKNDSAFTPELEQAYLSLITASRGCTSVQRIVADLIPRYASKCPTALEAAAKVVINMYKWSMAVINRGEDVDSVAFQTAKSSILGLSDICCTASAVAPTSSVIRGICSAVFQNVLTFFISTFEGKNVFEIVGKETVRIQDSSEFFSKLKQKLLDENESSPIKLSKLSALSLLWIFFCYPKELVSAWFELLKSNASEGIQTGQYFLSQMTIRLDNGGGYSGDETGDEPGSNTGGELSIRSNEVSSENLASDGTHVSGDVSTVKKSCLLGLVLSKDPSLQSWMFSKYKKLCKLPSYKSLSNVRSSLEDVFKSFVEQMDLEDNQLDSDDDDSDPSKFIERAYLVPRFSNQPETGGELFGNEGHLRPSSGSYDNVFLARVSGQHLQSCSSIIPLESNIPGSNQDTGGTRSINCEIREHGDMPHGRSSVPRDLMNHQVLSPVTRSPLDFRSNSFDGRKHVHPERKDPMDFGSPLLRSSSGGVSNSFESPKPHLVSPYISTTTQIVWYSDGDGEAMDIFSASKQLWLGFSGSDASEAHIRFQLERFGAIEQFIFFPIKGFALVEYRNILDAVKAREYMRGHFPWNIKFMDIGLGTRGAMNGVAVGTSCHVYAGNVLSQWAKDEILHESRKVLYKGPYMVTDLSNEGALLMEFDTPEEAAAVMAHLRQHRKERSNYRPPYGGGPTNVGVSQTDGARSVPTPSNVGIRSNNHGNMSSSHVGSPFSVNHENQPMELVSPRVKSEIQGNSVQRGYSFQSKRAVTGSTEMLEPGTQKVDGNDNNLDMDPAQGGSHVFSRHTEQKWMYAKAGMELHSAPGSIPSVPVPTGTPSVPPPPPIHSSPFIRPVYLPPNSSWDPRGVNNNPHVNPISPGLMPNNFHGKPIVPPLISASVTPLAQVQGAPAQPFDQMFSVPKAAPQLSSLPPPLPEMPPPVPPSPPPLPQSQPPFVPPPPRSPPPPLLVQESSGVESSGQSLQYQWQGTLCKSGVQYCTIYAYRVDSDICKYSNAISEPIEWPAKLDMTKRTDFRHVKSTFTSTPAHKREICRLIPASAGDHKGFQDFVSYLKQRECSGVIKVPAVKSLWARLLFILPHSNETCSMLSIAPSTPDCLIALVLPKETNFEWV